MMKPSELPALDRLVSGILATGEFILPGQVSA
jgi:hypothetical protein